MEVLVTESDSVRCISSESITATGQPHPLLLYTVTKPLMGFLRPTDLLTVRAVCQTWRADVTPFLHDKFKIEIKSDKYFMNFTDTMSEVDSNRLPCSYLTLSKLNLNHFRHIGFYDQITVLALNCCDWPSNCLRAIVFQHFLSLQGLTLDASGKSNSVSSLPILPMSVGQHSSLKPLLTLRSIHLIGDFARKSDVIYEILRYSPNLEVIQVEKSSPGDDDLFGTWFFEIILSRPLPDLVCLDLDSAIIDLQVESLLREAAYPLTKLRLNLTQVHNPNSVVRRLLRKFPALENAEFELREPTMGLLETINRLLPKERFSVSIHSDVNSRIIFPFYSHL